MMPRHAQGACPTQNAAPRMASSRAAGNPAARAGRAWPRGPTRPESPCLRRGHDGLRIASAKRGGGGSGPHSGNRAWLRVLRLPIAYRLHVRGVTMTAKTVARAAVGCALGGAALAAAGYALYAGSSWLRFGRPRRTRSLEERDSLLRVFMPRYDVVERHQVSVDAPADVTLEAALDLRLVDSSVVRALFKMRELSLGGMPPAVEVRGG